jgi:hypothetical protein
MIKYPEFADELMRMLHEDQQVWKEFWATHFDDDQTTPAFRHAFEIVRKRQRKHAERMLAILEKIEQPSIGNIGPEAAQAISILALHDSLSVLRSVCDAFAACYERDKSDTYYQAIPSMIDRVRILERRPQVFGTQWEFDEKKYPYLPTVENIETIDARRKAYGIELLRWPKSLAIPEKKQPWLTRPVAEAIMRDITDEEFERNYQAYL